MKAGFSEITITPEPGTIMGGYRLRREGATGVHDNLYAKCAAISNGENLVIFISLDLLGLQHSTVNDIKRGILKRNQIDPGNVIISCTHTHSGPDTIFLSGGNSKVRKYCEMLKRKIPGLVESAIEEMKNVELSVVKAKVDNVAFNRRLILHNGKVALNLDFVDEEKIEERGPVDPWAVALFFKNKSGVKGALINFTCHATILNETNLLFSRDYPGYLVDFIRDNVEGNPTTIFFNGAFGNINQIEVPGVWTSNFDEARRIGYKIGESLLKQKEQTFQIDSSTIECRRKKIRIKRRESEFNRVDEIDERIKEMESNSDADEREIILLKEEKSLIKQERNEEVELHVTYIGETEILCLPGEIFVEYGIQLKKKSKYPICMIFGNSNGYLGYVPLQSSFNQGAYETRLSRTSRLVPEAGEIMVKTLNSIRR